MGTTRKTGLNSLLHIPYGDICEKMKEVFVVGHVPNKTHVFASSDFAPAPQDMILKMMTQTVNL